MMKQIDRDSHLPKMTEMNDGHAPEAPHTVAGTGLDKSILLDLALKFAYVHSQITTSAVADHLLLPRALTGALLEELRQGTLLETLGQDATFGYRYAISGRGRETAARLLESNGYIGAAPVTLESYQAMLEWQVMQNPDIAQDSVKKALQDMVLPDDVLRVAELAVSSGRSLFLSGPPGNGKTSIGRKLHNALRGTLWIPHSIAVENNIIRLFDPHCHEVVEYTTRKHQVVDQRWVKIRRPFIVAGGEMTLESLDLAYRPSLKFYEAPLHMKANGGTFLIDDFGRQRVEPETLLNRWIIPLEHQIDFLTLHTGQKIQVPFLLRLIIATNLDPNDVTDPAFLRRIGYRVRLNGPTAESYTQILSQYGKQAGLSIAPELVEYLLSRYKAGNREMRACEPRDLLERVRDACRQQQTSETHVTRELIDIAWNGYFGEDS